MIPSITLDASLRVEDYNEAFVETIIPRSMTMGYEILFLFQESDRAEVQHTFDRCKLQKPGTFAMIHGKKITTVASQPNAFPSRSEYSCIIAYLENEMFNMALVVKYEEGTDHEANELKDFFNKAPIALHWLSDQGKVLWANDREIEVLEYPRSEYIGKDIMQFCPDSKEKVLEIFKELGSGNTIRDVPVRFRSKSGKIKDFLIDSNVNYKDDGSFNHTRCFIRDDTGRKVREARAEVLLAEAKRVVEDKGRFVAKLLHEIKTPLHIISMAMDLGEKQCDECREKNHLTLSQTAHLSRLVTNMSSAMRFDDGIIPPEQVEKCNLARFFEEYRKPSFPAKFKSLQMMLSINEGDGHGLVMVDTTKITIILDELLLYCAQVSANCDTLALKVTKRARSREYAIEVSYVGQVLNHATVQNLFHNYWLDSSKSSDQPLSADTPGLNLGLNIAFNNAQCLGSDLSVESTPAKTCFRFSISPPAAESESKPTISQALVEHDPVEIPQGIGLNDCKSRHVLIVEDNTICQKMCKRMLTKLGHTCSVADNGAIAVDMITDPDCVIYDVVFMDIRMPIMDGIEATARIKEYLDRCQIKLPIIALTAEDDFDITAVTGFSSMLAKPASVADIKKLLAEVE